MSLTDDVKVALRVSSDAYDAEVAALVAAALADMRRVGVPGAALSEDDPDPLARMAAILFCKSRFGYDNDEASRFEASYRQTVADLVGSAAYLSADQAGGDGGDAS